MACTFKYFPIFIVFLAYGSVVQARSLGLDSSTLVTRLKLDDDGGSSNCWDSLMQLQSCTGELIIFFFDGETNLGHGCCQAIRTITQQCWPTMMDTLGFTREEGDILEGYCVKPEDSPPPSLNPTKSINVKETVVP